MNSTGKRIGFSRHHGVILRKIAVVLTGAGLLCASPGLFQGVAGAAAPTPPFTECPAVGWNTSCTLLIDITANGRS